MQGKRECDIIKRINKKKLNIRAIEYFTCFFTLCISQIGDCA